MTSPPVNIRALTADGLLEIEWPDRSNDEVVQDPKRNRSHRLPFRYVRGECQCAACVDENTGKRILDLSTIPDDVHPVSMNFTGNYALKFTWSDGHDSGLFTWTHLRQIGDALEARDS